MTWKEEKMRTLKVLVIVMLLATPIFAQSGKFAVPANADLDKFPILQKPLSVQEQAQFGLSPKILEEPVVVQNHFRNLRDKMGRFVLETLPAGTLVFVDKKGKLRYKANCGNRLAELVQCPQINEPIVNPSTKTSTTQKTGAWSRFWGALGDVWGKMWEMFGFLLGFVIPLLLFVSLLGSIAWWINQAIKNHRNRNANGQNSMPIVTTPLPILPNPVVPVAEPAQTSTANPTPVSGFPSRRVTVDLGNRGNATRIRAGRNITRLEFERGNDGSTTVRFFEV